MKTKVAENPSKNRELDIPLLVITGLLVTLYVASNILSVKVLRIGRVTLFDTGTLTFPLTYLLSEVLAEIWGLKTARRVIFLTAFCNLLLSLLLWIGIFLPAPDYMAETTAAFRQIFSYVPRIVLASLVGFLLGELSNAWMLLKIRQYTGKRFLWMRTIGSSAFGYLLDTAFFMALAFAGTVPLGELFSMIGVQYLFKLGIEMLLNTPMAYGMVGWLKRHGGYRA